MAGRRPSLAALAGAGLATAGCLLNLAWGTAAGAKTSFTGFFPASIYWGNSEYDPLNSPKGTSIYYIDTDKNSKSTHETDQKLRSLSTPIAKARKSSTNKPNPNPDLPISP